MRLPAGLESFMKEKSIGVSILIMLPFGGATTGTIAGSTDMLYVYLNTRYSISWMIEQDIIASLFMNWAEK